MPDHEDSLGGETFSGEEQPDPAEQSLGDGSTLGGGDTSSLSDTSEVGGEHLAVGLPVIDPGARQSDLLEQSTEYSAEKTTILAGASITNTIGMTLNKIPAGTFMMGSPTDQTGRDYREHQHKVTISKAFYIATTVVTQGQWKAVMGTEPWKSGLYVKEGPNYPAVNFSRDAAVAYCKKLSEKEAKTYRLPTEAEWEYACRAGTKTIWSFGNDEKALSDHAWWQENAVNIGEEYAHQVGLKKPNAWGLYDMYGNVHEWCHDYYGEDYYKQSPEKDPQGPDSGFSHVMRGGSFATSHSHEINSLHLHSADRYGIEGGNCLSGNGFRVIRELD